MPRMTDFLLNDGICTLPKLFTGTEIDTINTAVDPLLASRRDERRAYVHPEEMGELGVLKMVFTDRMMNAVFSVMPDPVLYHCHIYEIAANDTRSHIFADTLLGWHRDPDSSYYAGNATHVSIFVYLTDVGSEDGAFEFIPGVPPTKWLHNAAPYIQVHGSRGFSFAWHRNYFHRAAPNRGPVRRRLVKFSIQRNAFRSAHLSNPHFQALLAKTPEGDPRMDLLLGRYQGKTAPQLAPLPSYECGAIATNAVLNLSSVELTKAQLRDKARVLKDKIRKREVVFAYD